jgi:5-formyltetrahydrofolate cyclo-ligase
VTGLTKDELRSRMRRLRASMDPQERIRLVGRIEERLVAIPEFIAAGSVLLFYSFGSEVATGGLIDHALAGGKSILLPYLEGDVLEAAEIVAGEELVPTTYGPKEPPRRTAVDPGEVDLVVTPGLAFDRRGYRVGYGGGFYDRYLARLRPEANRAAVGFSFQVVEEVPAGPRDERVHLIVTDAETIDCR